MGERHGVPRRVFAPHARAHPPDRGQGASEAEAPVPGTQAAELPGTIDAPRSATDVGGLPNRPYGVLGRLFRAQDVSLLRRAASLSGVPGKVRPCPPDHAHRGMTFRDKQDRSWLARTLGASFGCRRGGWLAPLDLTEEAEELAVRRQHHAGVVVAEGCAIGLHGPIEGIELGVNTARFIRLPRKRR